MTGFFLSYMSFFTKTTPYYAAQNSRRKVSNYLVNKVEYVGAKERYFP